ncbi:MAG: isopentenyl-diphosphate Delta-isomerase [Candidatus Micrarchaeota archaeon]|nr:isopentenyl-diphosphate Delta-isomerase [Candidatus Micrarchaeota archaeon]
MSGNDNQKVILVDESDREMGLEDKLAAHRNGAKLHRALSVMVFNGGGETLLQQRAMGKYHTQGRWSNTCCSHPYPGESPEHAAHRRLKEEMGFDCELNEAFVFTYRADVGNGLTEHEYDHVFFGTYDEEPKPDLEEAMAYRWESLENLQKELKENPGRFTPWLGAMVEKAIAARSAGS